MSIDLSSSLYYWLYAQFLAYTHDDVTDTHSHFFFHQHPQCRPRHVILLAGFPETLKMLTQKRGTVALLC